MAANIIISGSQYERRLISQRTRDALAVKRCTRGEAVCRLALPPEVTRHVSLQNGSRGRDFQAMAGGPNDRRSPNRKRESTVAPATIKLSSRAITLGCWPPEPHLEVVHQASPPIRFVAVKLRVLCGWEPCLPLAEIASPWKVRK